MYLSININEKLKKNSNINEKLKGVVKKDKKIEYYKYKNGLQPYGEGASKRLNFLSKCDYFWDFIKTKNISNSNPCQNRPT